MAVASPSRSPRSPRADAASKVSPEEKLLASLEIEAMPETTLAEGAAKQAAYEVWEKERSSDPQAFAADLYTAAFFLPKTKESRSKVPTSEHLSPESQHAYLPCLPQPDGRGALQEDLHAGTGFD